MVRRLQILTLIVFSIYHANAQSFDVDDLLKLSTLSHKSIDNYLGKKGFVPAGSKSAIGENSVTFFEKRKKKTTDTLNILRTVQLASKEAGYSFIFHTSSREEYIDGIKKFKQAGFICDKDADTSGSLFFQRRNMSVQAGPENEDGELSYSFALFRKNLPHPSSIQFAEDLLQFDSHEILLSFFGQDNVKSDSYYFSDTVLKKCSVLFPYKSRQAVFVWDDEANMKKLSYILISGILPTKNAAQYTGYVSQNTWLSKSGLYAGMTLRELLRVNENDFEFYGKASEFANMVVPEKTGKIDFKKTGVMLSCASNTNYHLLDKSKVSAWDAQQLSLPITIFYIMILP